MKKYIIGLEEIRRFERIVEADTEDEARDMLNDLNDDDIVDLELIETWVDEEEK